MCIIKLADHGGSEEESWLYEHRERSWGSPQANPVRAWVLHLALPHCFLMRFLQPVCHKTTHSKQTGALLALTLIWVKQMWPILAILRGDRVDAFMTTFCAFSTRIQPAQPALLVLDVQHEVHFVTKPRSGSSDLSYFYDQQQSSCWQKINKSLLFQVSSAPAPRCTPDVKPLSRWTVTHEAHPKFQEELLHLTTRLLAVSVCTICKLVACQVSSAIELKGFWDSCR